MKHDTIGDILISSSDFYYGLVNMVTIIMKHGDIIIIHSTEVSSYCVKIEGLYGFLLILVQSLEYGRREAVGVGWTSDRGGDLPGLGSTKWSP
jgi:hypothetical protein